MEFITEEIKTELGLSDDAIAKLTPLYENKVADLKKEFEGTANTNAEKILDGAATKVAEVTGVVRNQGEKVADYVIRANAEFKKGLEGKKAEYDQKLKEFDGSAGQKEELERMKNELDVAKQTLADYDTVKEKAGKYDETVEQLSGLKLQVAFQSVKPTFPDTVNPYEAKAKWDEFIGGVKEKYTIELVEGEAVCKDKDNEYKTVKLKDLVDKDENLTKLMQGRRQEGTGGKQVDMTKIDGVPFDVPKGISSEERSKLIREHLAKDGVGLTHKDYSSKFDELNTKIKNAK